MIGCALSANILLCLRAARLDGVADGRHARLSQPAHCLSGTPPTRAVVQSFDAEELLRFTEGKHGPRDLSTR